MGRTWWGGIILVAVLLVPGPRLGAQEEANPEPPPAEPASPTDTTAPPVAPAPGRPAEDGVFFADILVRGQPVFQVGSLAGISATERAQIINRRLAGVLNQALALEDEVSVQLDADRQIALLTLNNRVLMTVTQQDAADLGTTVDELAQQWADRLNQRLVQPNLALDVLQRLRGTARQLRGDTILILPSLLGALVLVGVTWLVAKGVRRLGLLWAEQTEGDRSTEILIGRLCYGGVWLLGTVVALGVLGLDFATLLGTLGLTSVAIGFSLKDVLSNYISGVILLAARPFRISDQVVIGNYEGTVVQIQLRATTMRTYDGRLVYIPNQQVFQSSVVNNTDSPVRRSSLMLGIAYEADIDRARQVIIETVRRVEGIEAEPEPLVLVQKLAASTVQLEVWFWVNSRRQSFLQVTSTAAQAIKEQLQAADIEMPTEIFTLTFRNGQIPSPPSPMPQSEISL
jgi:small conductance mechanosensitive channel